MQLLLAHAFCFGRGGKKKTKSIDVDISKFAAGWFDSLWNLSVLCEGCFEGDALF